MKDRRGGLHSSVRMRSAILALLLALLTASSLALQADPGERNLLTGTMTQAGLSAVLLSADDWHPLPRAAERHAWESLDPRLRAATVTMAEKHLGAEWATPKASVFLDFQRNGDRSRYQSISFGRRKQLADLVLGECMEGKGRFLDDIANGIWTICEETYWGVPAHLSLQRQGFGLPDVTEPTVDLFAAETGSLLAWTYYLLKDSLDGVSPLISQRIEIEVKRRILDVNLSRNDFWWMGFDEVVNNWNPWICSNWLTAVLVLERDQERRAQSVLKIMRVLDNFLNPYPADGGCDEGPSYWTRAGGSLFDCLELLAGASGGAIDIFDRPLIGEMGRYISRAYITGPYYVNFADAPAKVEPDASTVFRYGKSIHDSTMVGFGAFLAREQRLGHTPLAGMFGVLGRVLPALFTLDTILATRPRELLMRDTWLPDIQVMMARSVEGSSAGLYCAAKGGHNAESHNHNDVGNFVVYADGTPVIIDIGVETYTAKTFGKDRYSIWTMQSAYHNLPTVNGVMQQNGADYRATNVRHAADDSTASLSLELTHAYPKRAGIRSWERTITLVRGREVRLRDVYQLEHAGPPVELTLMTCCIPEVLPKGRVRLTAEAPGGKSQPTMIEYDPGVFSARCEPIRLTDERLRSSWGDRIYRILLTMKNTPSRGEYLIRVH